MVFPAKIGDKLRVYIPKEVGSALKLKVGDYVVFRVSDGKVSVEKLK